MKNKSSLRMGILCAGVIAMLFAGIIYAWSILKVPFAEEVGLAAPALALNFTLTMCFFCIGGVVSSFFVKRIGTAMTLVLSGVLAGAGIVLSGMFADSVAALYVFYAFMAGLGIGIAYIVIISTVNAWFPDRRGLSSGALMMGFGASSLLLGNLADRLFATELGWRGTYIAVGIFLGAVILLASLFIRRPPEGFALPAPAARRGGRSEDFTLRDFTPGEMLRRFSFWRAFLYLICITAVGNSVISFCRDLALSVGAEAALASVLVGVLAVCNGLGRILTGALFDAAGRRITMLCANLLTMAAAGLTLVAVVCGSLPLCIVGLCLTGLSYGTSPTVSSAFTSAFYGQKHFAANLGFMNINLMCASFVATACSALIETTGGYTVPFVLLLGLSAVALVLNLSIKRP
ncbi:MAG: MFS transporter [Clostridia bacterium]|nr:MFS transporter [Clostridia bacterium]